MTKAQFDRYRTHVGENILTTGLTINKEILTINWGTVWILTFSDGEVRYYENMRLVSSGFQAVLDFEEQAYTAYHESLDIEFLLP